MKLRRLGQTAVVLSGGYLAALAATRRWHQHWGATDEEMTKPLPGDDLIPAARLDSTHAITIHAPAERIWPWLAQMGYEDRAGSYSYDLFERSIGRNLYQVDPDIQPLAAGDAMPFYPGAPMTVAVADPPHALVLWQVTASGKAIDPAGPWGQDHVAWSWAFVLEPVDAARTRLLVRMRVSYRPVAKWAPFMWLLVEPAHFVMGRRQLLGLSERAEAARPPDDHQRTDFPTTAGAEAAATEVGGGYLTHRVGGLVAFPGLRTVSTLAAAPSAAGLAGRRRPARLAPAPPSTASVCGPACGTHRPGVPFAPWNRTELPKRPLVGPGLRRSTLGDPWAVVEAADVGALGEGMRWPEQS